jgi:type IX secretion system PorP/SprF family membrane protein
MAIPQYNSGAGLSVYNYRVGVYSDINVAGSYAYTLNISDDQSVYLGLGLNYLHSSFNLTNSTAADRSDPIFTSSSYAESLNGLNTSFGAGYRWTTLFVGVGINNIFTPKRGFGSLTYPVYREYKFFTSYKYELDKIWAIEGIAIPAYISGRGLALEFAAIGRYDKGLWFGLNINRPLNYGLILGMNIDEHFYFNYNAAISSQPNFANTTGNHEVCIGYYFNADSKQKKSGFNVINKVAKLFGKRQRF